MEVFLSNDCRSEEQGSLELTLRLWLGLNPTSHTFITAKLFELELLAWWNYSMVCGETSYKLHPLESTWQTKAAARICAVSEEKLVEILRRIVNHG